MRPLAMQAMQDLDRSIVRYLNLRHLIETIGNGKVTTFAARVGKSRENIARVGGKNYNPEQRIGERFCSDIEIALNLEEGWMDRFHALPKQVPQELLQLLAGSQNRLAQDALRLRADGTLPIVGWDVAGQLCDGVLAAIPDSGSYMLAPVHCRRGYFLQVNTTEYMPYMLPGMLLQIDPDRRPSPQEAFERPTFVVVKRPELVAPVIRHVQSWGDLVLYAAVGDVDLTPFGDPTEWGYGGMVVMRLIP